MMDDPDLARLRTRLAELGADTERRMRQAHPVATHAATHAAPPPATLAQTQNDVQDSLDQLSRPDDGSDGTGQ